MPDDPIQKTNQWTKLQGQRGKTPTEHHSSEITIIFLKSISFLLTYKKKKQKINWITMLFLISLCGFSADHCRLYPECKTLKTQKTKNFEPGSLSSSKPDSVHVSKNSPKLSYYVS